MRPKAALAVAFLVTAGQTFAGCFDWVRDLQGRHSAPGEWHRDFLNDSKYESLLVEIDYVDGFAPSQIALDLLRRRIDERLTKPAGFEIRLDDKLKAGGDGVWSIRSIVDVEAENRDATRGAGRAVLYVLYLDGRSDADVGNERVLGAAYSGSSVVMFQETIRETARGIPLTTATPESIEKAVLVHELGHILGLVNNHLPMVQAHEDSAHPTHSSNQNSVMYWAVERDAVRNLLMARTEPPNQFDANDIADMRAAGGK